MKADLQIFIYQTTIKKILEFDSLVLFYVRYPCLLVAEPFAGVIPAEPFDEMLGVFRDGAREVYHVYAFQNDRVDLHRIGGTERGPGKDKREN